MTARGHHEGRARRAVVGWAVLPLALAGGGCGSSADDEPSQRAATVPATTTTAPPARTSTTPRSTAGGGKPTGSARTRTTTIPGTQAPAARSPGGSPTTTTTTPTKRRRPRPAKVGKPQTFSGDGERVIGTLVLKRNAVVRWTVSGGGAFTVRDADGRLKISGRGTSGQSFAGSGDYRAVKVTARGRWTLSFASLGA